MSWSDNIEDNVDLALLYSKLPERHRQVLELRAKGLTYKEIGVVMSITQERVRQIDRRTRKMLFIKMHTR